MATMMKKTMGMLVLAALVLASSVLVQAQSRRGGVVVVPRGVIASPFYRDPFWRPYYSYGAYPFDPYPFGVYSYGYRLSGRRHADVRVEGVPKQTEVFVDGYYAGTAGDFDGVFKHLQTTPGGHAITLYLDGYRTVTQEIYARPDSTFKMRSTMDRLAAGETSTPPPSPARPLPTAAGSSVGTPHS
jgi:hypothetical protein